MELTPYFKSILDQDPAHIVICDLNHTILYMNPSAVAGYGKYGGAALLGRSVLNCHGPASKAKIQEVLTWFSQSKDHNVIFTSHSNSQNMDIYMVALRDGDGTLIGYYEKHESRVPETRSRYDFA